MIIREPGKSRLLPNEKERLAIIKQIRALVNEGVQILVLDDVLSFHEAEVLAFRIEEYLVREARAISKNLEKRYLGYDIPKAVKRPRRPKQLNVQF